VKRFKIEYRFQSWPITVVNTVGFVQAKSTKDARAQALTHDGLIVITVRRVYDKEA
jgi:hypothetical protein